MMLVVKCGHFSCVLYPRGKQNFLLNIDFMTNHYLHKMVDDCVMSIIWDTLYILLVQYFKKRGTV